MNPRGIFGFLAGLLAIGLLVGLGVGVYQAGIAQGIVDAGRYPAGAAVPVAGYGGFGWHGGPGIFGILFGIFFLFLIFGLLRAAFSRGRGYGPGWGYAGYGHGPGWGKGPGGESGFEGWREERERRLAEVHRRLHEETDGGAPGSGIGSGSSGSPAR